MNKFSMTVLFASLTLALCASTPIVGAPVAAPKGSEPLRLALVTSNASDYWTVVRAGALKAAQDFAVRVDFRIPGMGSVAEQEQMVRGLLGKGLDGMAISPVDPASQVEMLDRVVDESLLFTQDSDAPKSKRVCFIGRDDVGAGRMAGRELRRVLPAGGDVMVFIGIADTTNTTERLRGLKSALVGSNIRVLDVRADDTDRAKTRDNVVTALREHPKLAGCVGIWSYHGAAILKAVKYAGRVGKTKIVCFDEDDEALKGVARGEISATIVSQPYEIGYQSVALMTKYLRGDKSVVPIDQRYLIPSLTITKSNVAAFQEQLDSRSRSGNLNE